MSYAFCYLCGAKTIKEQEEGHPRWRCTQCGQVLFKNAKPATEIILVTEDNKAVIVTRAREPYKGKYDLPGGFLELGETLDEALERELLEEVNLKRADYGDPIYIGNMNVDYPWGKEEHRVLSVRFTARISSDTPLEPNDDVAKIEFKKLEELTPDMFGWSGQYTGVKEALAYWEKSKPAE